MVYNLHITTDEAGALLELSDSLADQLEGVVEAFNHTIHPAGGYRIYETIHLDADGFVLEGMPFWKDTGFICGDWAILTSL